ncbi:MAG: STAS domain-containing protein [Terriglobales bacterium]
MLAIHVVNLRDLAVVECRGRIVCEDAVFRMRDIVQAQAAARIIVLDLSDVEAIGGGGVGMLAFLDAWARERDVQFKLFRPSVAVVDGLVNNRAILDLEIASFDEMMRILMEQQEEGRRTVAA